MKALTVCEGWASLIFHPQRPKNIENRTWPTKYRGRLLIHAGKSKRSINESRAFCDRLSIEFPTELTYGAILGMVDLVGCDRDSESIWAQPNHWHWRLENPRQLIRPIVVNGALGLWVPDHHIIEQINNVGAAGWVTLPRSIPGRDDRLLQPQVSDTVASDSIEQLAFPW